MLLMQGWHGTGAASSVWQDDQVHLFQPVGRAVKEKRTLCPKHCRSEQKIVTEVDSNGAHNPIMKDWLHRHYVAIVLIWHILHF